jgi:SAM-dependent methyltransferase
MSGVDPQWYRNVFDQEWLRFFAHKLPPEITCHEVDFLQRVLGLRPGARVLDLACGIGRHSLELARRGFQVVGVDLSQACIDNARRGADDQGVEVEFVRGDLRELQYQGEFEAAINMFTAFGYLESDQENQAVLDRASRSLAAGGALFMDVVNALWLIRHFEPRGWRRLYDGTLLLEERSYHWRTGRIDNHFSLIRPDGERRERASSLRLYTAVEMAAMMERVGLELESQWGDFQGSAYGLDTPRMILLARKPLDADRP